jgi:tRNA threonylcarbamoyladenosine biosynthesis protein TsaB
MLLGIDTCGGLGTVAVARSNGGAISVIGQKELAGKTYSAELVPKIQELLKEQGVGLQELEAVVVVHGPGSFTGVRIGVSTAKALAEALNISLLAVSRLAVLAHKAGTDAAVLDAGRGEFFVGTRSEEALLLPGEVRERLLGRLAVCEESTALVFPEAVLADPPSAADALTFAAPRLRSREFNDVATIDGNYLRRSDAELFAKHIRRSATDKTE